MRRPTLPFLPLVAMFIASLYFGSTEMSQAADATSETTVTQATVGTLGPNSVGVVAILQPPLRAEISVFGASSAPMDGKPQFVRWEATHIVTTGQQVMSGQQCFNVVVAAPFGTFRGSVGFQPMTPPTLGGQAWPENTAILDGDGGELRLNGPDVTTASDLRVIQWGAVEAQPATAQIEWIPTRLPRDWLPPEDIKTARVTNGTKIRIGDTTAEAIAIEGRTLLHPARIIFRLGSAH